MKNKLSILTILMVCLIHIKAISQHEHQPGKMHSKGYSVMAGDSSSSINFGAQLQALYVGVRNQESHVYSDQMMIRRARLRFHGFAYTPKLTYELELGLSNQDISSGNIPENDYTANIIREAVVKYNFYKHWSVWLGQAKLPGNIERVMHSSNLQFVDRSVLDSKFNIGEATGVQLRYEGEYFRFLSAVSSGEGHNITVDNIGGYDYTSKIEFLPFGGFFGEGAFSGADLHRENDIKLIVGIAFDYNDHASREGGPHGEFLSEQRNLESFFFDAHLKYRGFSAMAEYVTKNAIHGAMLMDDLGNFEEAFFVGKGLNVQAGYLFKNNIEIAGRYTDVQPGTETHEYHNQQYTLGLSKYIAGHALKIQSDITWIEEAHHSEELMYRLQLEITL